MAEIPLPITYTPTTHRISKAKKGKRVHACEFPGCNKVFTRAEHRRRHELNHNPEASFPCTYEGCRKAFHRSDLLARHMERHELDVQSDSGSGSRPWRHQSKTNVTPSITSVPTSMVTSMPLDVTSASYPTSQVSTPMSAASPIIGGAIHPDLSSDLSLPWSGMEIPFQPRPTLFGSHIRDSPDDMPFYSSPETCGSPASDAAGYVMPPHPSSAPTSVMEPYAYHDLANSPLQLPTTREWDGVDVVPAPNMMPVALDGNPMLQSVDHATLHVPNVGGDEWYSLRRELTSAPGVVSGNDRMEIMDTVKWQDCFECYWQHFHPLFPIVHRPTFLATRPSPLMAGAMVAIGSQYDTRPNSKEYSLALLEACLKLLAKRSPVTSRSRVADIQTVFLLEFLSKFRSRKADVQISHRFRSLYGSFMQDGHWTRVNPLAVLNTLSTNFSQEALKGARNFWIEHETRRRVLQAAFILDIQQSALFGQPPVLLQPSPASSYAWQQGSRMIDIPFPCGSELWESSHPSEWLALAQTYIPASLASVAASFDQHAGLQADQVDFFQSSLLVAYGLSGRAQVRNPGGSLDGFVSELEQAAGNNPLMSPYARTLFIAHTMLATRFTPVHTLLTVSGESWLFNQKLAQEGDFRNAKITLRKWVSNSDNVKKAVWHAVRALRYIVDDPDVFLSTSGTPAHWNNNPNLLPAAPRTSPSNMLQTNWSVYMCALICWAYGFDATASRPPVHDNYAEMTRAYIYNMISLAPTWEHVSPSNIPPEVRCNTTPLLTFIRLTRFQESRVGGLLNEGDQVLARLSEPRDVHGAIRGMWSF
ncbi:putative C2H2 finger domain protein [Talaromyces proteolyticus]|uniref:C2H2 finger domain protein n=1 Tax=Talaromyces proteolyticus TaxID=1131652 RepID=A0AAD4Q3M3_9EURO|nr:putative C2H2 finger domain protein [Talaromyces proteolyticus]KAH8701887.1 putative C2H2 finger domain protein [Talaromyces proteolyticus]